MKISAFVLQPSSLRISFSERAMKSRSLAFQRLACFFLCGLQRSQLHESLLKDFRKMLIRHGYHGYGNPGDDNGIVIFADDRLIPVEVVAEIPDDVCEIKGFTSLNQFGSLKELRRFLRSHWSPRVEALAEQLVVASKRKRRS